ncbi:Ribosomal protein S3a [Spironucleus salmonicida]|uniref:Ribosomal protein S3a n=1 Tax=Spironucleus salmonicida TaxID=348837 RepID=V6M581_9EUKA|nr:Ribosomal protein S3a [Spironucleus salmonicida]|eukprot:EST48509.1 Ribosomal protein S3a [Spironucleus salmonicida]
MAIGNNSNKKKKIVQRAKPDPFLRKEWYDVQAPTLFKKSDMGQTVVTKTSGMRVSTEVVKGRIVKANLGDLAENETQNGTSNFNFKIVSCADSKCLTDFAGYQVVRHYEQSLFKKGCSHISCTQDVTTKDGYVLRVFATGFTAKSKNIKKSNCYAKTSELNLVRKAMLETMHSSIKDLDCHKLMTGLANKSINTSIMEAAKKNFAVRDIMITRVKVISTPKYNVERINKLHSGTSTEFGKPIEVK